MKFAHQSLRHILTTTTAIILSSIARGNIITNSGFEIGIGSYDVAFWNHSKSGTGTQIANPYTDWYQLNSATAPTRFGYVYEGSYIGQIGYEAIGSTIQMTGYFAQQFTWAYEGATNASISFAYCLSANCVVILPTQQTLDMLSSASLVVESRLVRPDTSVIPLTHDSWSTVDSGNSGWHTATSDMSEFMSSQGNYTIQLYITSTGSGSGPPIYLGAAFDSIIFSAEPIPETSLSQTTVLLSFISCFFACSRWRRRRIQKPERPRPYCNFD